MHKLIEVMEKQLEIEKKNAEEKLTANNLDTIFKLTSVINNLKCMESGSYVSKETVSEVAEGLIKKYSNGRYDHNIDALYDVYLAAKQDYKKTGDQGHKDKLMEAVGRLMVEMYDLLSAMIMDSDFQEEKREIMNRIRMLADA
jgi:hypothetical protein|nr:MAG TPA: hypothetical protein [Caudoviricetes sp.]